MFAVERGAQLTHDFVVAEALDGAHLAAFAGHREGDARARGRAVDQHGAGAAHAVLAAEVGAGQALAFAQEVAEVRPRLGEGLDLLSVDDELDGLHGCPLSP